ncbi:MAG: MFS transporter [Chloroflexi bacterium]|nr:MFS transporter [Chloroflexota bacterium]
MSLASNLRAQVIEPLRNNAALLMVCVATGVIMLGQGVIAPVLPLYAKDFGVSTTMIGASISVFGLARILFNLPAGLLSDRLGRRLLLVGGPIITAVGSFLSAFAGDIWSLLVFRFIAGIGSAAFMTAGITLVTDISTPENRGRMLSLHLGSLLIGVSIGPALGGLTAELINLRAPFILVGVLSAACAVWALRVMPETHRQAVTAGAGEREAGETEVEVTTAGRPVAPVSIRSLAGNMGLLLVSLVTFSIFFTRTGARQTVLPLAGNEDFGLSAGLLGLIFAMMALINLATIIPSGAWADRFGRKRVIVPSALLAAGALGLFAVTDSLAVFLIAAVLLALGTGISGPAPAAYAADVIPAQARGMGMGLFRTYSDIGFVVGPLLLGWIVDATGGFGWALAFNAALMAAGALAFGLFAKETVAPRQDGTAAT